MRLRYLFGPVTAKFANQYLEEQRRQGDCLAFHTSESVDVKLNYDDTWEEIIAKLPPDWRPDLLLLYLPYTAVPPGLLLAPIPIIALAPDWNLLWHTYRHTLPHCDRVLTDAPGVEALRRLGIAQASTANLFGLGRDFDEHAWPDQPRDIDILFVGNFHPIVQQERLPWIARLARLGYRWSVEIRQGVFGAEYLDLMNRARIVFNRSLRGEANKRAFETLAAGALLFQEADNREIPALLHDRQDCVFYNADNLEELLEHYLENEEERSRLALAGQRRASEFTFEGLWVKQLAELGQDWAGLVERANARQANLVSPEDSINLRLWEACSGADTQTRSLELDLAKQLVLQPQAARMHYGLGLLESLRGDWAKAAACFRRAVAHEPAHVVAGAALASALAAGGQKPEATEAARQTLARLDSPDAIPASCWQQPPFPTGFGPLRVAWEAAGWKHAGAPGLEIKAKTDCLKAHLHQLLAETTGELHHAYEAALLQPEAPGSRMTLGNLLRKADQRAAAVTHFRRAQQANPFDHEATRQLFIGLGESGDGFGQRRLAAENRLLHEAALELVPAEGWIDKVPPPPDELVSIVVLCCNEITITRLCLESVCRHTRPPFELVVVDNGSTDETPSYLRELSCRPEPKRVVILRNETNAGFPAGCNQALAKARGQQVVFLNNDTVVVAGWLESLLAALFHDWPKVGLVGAVSNYAPPPQLVQPGYRDLSGLDEFAAARRTEFAGQTLSVERLTGFCLLARRAVLKRIGSFDTRFGLGFFDDDDLGIRAREAGFELRAALDSYIHHFGSRTFRGLGIDCEQQLRDNFAAFKAKWGEERTAGYGMPHKDTRQPEVRLAAAPITNGPKAPGSVSKACTVSLCMIVKNEEHNLPACLESIAGLVDDIVIVDTGSSDATKAVAERYGARVFDFPWVDSFAVARNESLRHAKGDWIFWMDADDRLEESSRPLLKQLFADLRPGVMAFSMKCLCVPDPSHPSPTVVDHIRLFPNQPQIRWHYRVHEQILPSVRAAGGNVCFAPIVIRHVGYKDPALRWHKLERDLRLLKLDHDEKPDEPFNLFNLGCVYQELGATDEALRCLHGSLERSQPTDSIVRKLYALIAGCHRQLGQPEQALAACTAGRVHYPDDAEILFHEGLVRRELHDAAGSEAAFLRLLSGQEKAHFASVETSLRGSKARHNLAVLYLEQGRLAEAEAQWRAALAVEPDYGPGWLGFGEICLQQRRWQDVELAINRLSQLNGSVVDAKSLQARLDKLRHS
ncbi:MAG TPA: glycosyltransferase [Gemmataceae bacterium]|jgi:glycosyltransferase involved in cell wall biosynthesis/Flp pilus assembly protein TadD|nr:glycosyltransferase [Gemmataceae bacterium]